MNSLTSLHHPEAAATSSPNGHHLILIDAHVHIYDCFDIDTFLDAAWQNFHHQAGKHTNFTGLLLLTESGHYQQFQTLAAQASARDITQGWSFYPTEETCSLRVTDGQGKTLYLIAGRQVITAEKLEVLALICDRTFPDGLTATNTIAAIQNAGGLAVLPWGVGKWIGQRGQLITQLLQQPRLSPLFLGDNSGRPQFWGRPDYFSQAEQQRLPILPGTDPLPLSSEVSRPGKFGLMVMGELDKNKPGSDIKAKLLDPSINCQSYGRLESPLSFVRNQIALRTKSSQPLSSSMNHQIPSTPGIFPETADIETSTADYATRFAGAIGSWLLQVQETATLKMLSAYPGANVLDVGGGHGQLTKALIEQGYHVTVLGSAEVCKARIQPYLDEGQCNFQVGDVLAMPYRDNTFDIVISYRFLAHVTQWQQFLKELARVADQAVIVDYPTVRSANAIAPALFKFKKGLEGNTRPFVCYNERDITDFYQSIGWVQRQRYAQFFWPMVLHRKLGNPTISATLEDLPRRLGVSRLLGSPVIAQFEQN